ncbi:uncharacterized protein LOC132937513 [Metopolophium dirhodum]|uniref:uncharacterized protein LOC132937513 n=1 Tax=Metopolophium dirhodum TaxID=44670 RepID=UPI00298FD88B|nr:uncharacterized protein LOC132937513 [Metopolophium dirhodum]
MAFTLTSKQVLEFLPLNTWTEVHLLESDLKNGYVVTTKEKMEKRKKDMESISLASSLYYDKVTQFETFKIVAVEIEGKWFRGKLISFNEFVTNNTMIQLIDYGSVYETKLENLFVLPYFFLYEPLALPVIFKDYIPKKTTFSIKPLLSESNLYEGAVLVDVHCNDKKMENCVDEKQLLKSKKDLNSANDSKIISVRNNITHGHDINESSLHVSRTFRKGSFISKEKLNNVPLKNEDYCILTYFKDFTCLYVGKAIQCGNNGSYNFVDYDTLLNTAKSIDKILKYNPVVGDIVKVYSSESDGLYRAKILKNNKGCYDVFYIDFGNIETVSSNVIYELTDELNKPGIAVKIGLGELKDIQTTEQIEDMFQTFCDVGKPFIIEFNENSKNCLENVKLKDIENGSYINSNYLMKCTSIQTEESIQKPKNITENDTVLINTPELEVIPNIELRTDDTVFCTNGSNKWQSGDHVEFLFGKNVENIFVRNIKLYEKFKNVLDQLKGENSEHYKPIAVKSGDFVAVYSTKNNAGVYRAMVLIPDDNTNMVKCSLIDFGENYLIPSKNIFALPNYVSLNKIPTIVRRVSLTGLNNISNINIKTYLSSLKGKIYAMKHDKKPGQRNRNEVVLKELHRSVSLNDEIQKLFYNESSPRETILQR